jgi:hypothetical protein
MKILFVYDHKYPEIWRDGLWASLNLLEKQGFEIWRENLQVERDMIIEGEWDFILGWGAFNSSVDRELQKPLYKNNKKGLCVAGNSFPPEGLENYNVCFYETNWTLKEYLGPYINKHPGIKTELVHAFGINSDIYKIIPDAIKIWDWLTVGSFSLWKRQYLLTSKAGYRLAIGEIQKENLNESIDIIGDLLVDGVSVSDMVSPEKLVMIYNSSDRVYIPSDINGGGERAVLEARACGVSVEVEKDNPKLQELLTWKERGKIPDQFFYADRLKAGVLSCF